MKKIHMFAALLAMLMPIAQVWAGGTTYYAAIKANVSSSGGGKVYASTSDSETTSNYGNSSKATATGSNKVDGNSASITLYAFAKADYGYKLSGWSKTDGGTILSKSNVNPYSITITSSNTSNSPTPEQYYAVFEPNTSYVVNLVKPDVGVTSYTVAGPTGFSGSGLSNGGNMDAYAGESYSFTCTVADGYEFIKWTINGTDAGTSTTLTKNFSSASTVQAVVNKLVTYYATCQAVPAGCSYKVGSTTVSSSEYQTSGYGTLTVNLSAPTAASGYMFAGWYEIVDGNKTIISTDASTTVTKKSDVTLGADFVAITAPVMLVTSSGIVDYDDFDAAFAAAKSGDKLKVVGNGTLTANAAVAAGVTLEIASGVTLTVASGATLYIDGSATVNGAISGTVSKCTKLIQQAGQSDGVPFNPYGTVKYWKTAITTPSISVSSSATHTTIVNGLGQVFRTTLSSSAKLIKCTIDASVAVNHIKSISGESTSVNVVNDTLNSGMVVLLGSDCVINGGLTAKTGFRGVVDCAGNNCSTVSGYEVSGNNGKATFLNCPSFTGRKVIGITHDYFNCSSVTLSSYNAGGSCNLSFYDCGTKNSAASFSATYSKGPGDSAFVNFYSGYYNSFSYKTGYKVYGGSYKSDPATYIADQDNFEAVYDSSSKYYVVQEKTEVLNVAAINGTEYETLSAAIAAAGNGATISLIEGVDLTGTTVEVLSSKNITIALDKHTITGGKIINRGTLLITDITVANESNVKCDIENYGTLDLVFGTYTGSIANKAGTLTTHNGVFTGTLAKDGGTVNLKGGHFTADVTGFVTAEGYDVFKDTDNRFCVCELPNGTMYDTTVSSTAGYGATPYNDADFSVLYSRVKDNKTGRSDYSDANWKRLAQLLNFYQIFSNRGLDATIVFDRDVAKNSINLYAKSTASMPVDFKYDLPAGQLYRALSEVVVFTYGYYAKTYYSIFDENIKSVAMAVSDKSGNNNGTVCKAMVELWKDDRASDYSSTGHKITNTVYVAGQKLFTLGAGSNKAMIRPATGAATFYATLGAAMDAAADGGTVMLANDCDTALPLNKAGTYTFDTMGFAASDAVSVSDGLFVKSETAVDSSAKILVPDAKATTYVVAQKVASVGGTFYDNLTEAVGAANGATVTLLAATDETITLGEGQTFSLNKNDIAFDDAKVVTSVAGSSVKTTTAEGVTVYSLVKDVVTSGEANYPSIEAAIAAAEGNTVAVTVVAADTETIDLDAGKTLVVTVADGVAANVTVDPGEGAFIDTTTEGNTTTYESKKITVEMKEPQATVAVTKIDNGTESTVTDTTEINAAVTQLMGNHDVPRTDNTDKLDVVDVITVTPTKIVQEVVGAAAAFIRSATFDVVPHLNAGQSLTEGQKLKFRLPVDAAATQLAAVVYHGDAQFGIFAVQTYNAEKFIEVESDTFSPYGYELLDGETANPVAAIGTTGYASLAAAVAAASAGDTITMLADDNVSLTDGSRLTIDKSLTITGPVGANGEPLYTIYGTPAQTGTNNIYIDGSGTVTLSNLKIKDFGNNKGTDGSHAPVYVASSFTGTVNLDNLYISDFNRGGVFLYGGTFNVTDCYIDCANSRSGAFTKGIEIKGTATGTIADTVICNMERSSADYSTAGIEVYGNGSITVDGCTILSDVDPHQSVKGTYGIVSSRVGEHDPSGGSLHVTDCNIDVSNAALSVADDDEYGPVNNYSIVVDGEDTYFSNYIATWSAGSSITINEGEFNEDVYADAGTINITGGTFNNFLPDTSTGTISISGGSFDAEVPEEYCADGYIPAPQDPNTDMYTVKTGSYVAQIDTTKYETFAEAIEAAEEYKTANGDYPVITVLDTTAEQTNPDWKIADGKLVHKVYVAQIVIDAGATTNKYETLAEAVAAAPSGGTVTLLADVTVNTRIDMTAPITVDFNGKTVTSAADNRVFKIATAVGEYTFKNGTVNTTNPCYGLFRVDNASTVTVEGITTTNDRSWGCNFRVAGGAQVLVTNCTITATNGGGVYAEGGSTVNVYDSTIAETGTATDCNASAFAVGEGATITVHNGTYSGEYGAFVCSSGGTIEILDGSVTGRRYAIESDARAGGNEDNSIADSIIRVAGGTIDGQLHEEIQLYNSATLTYANKMQISGGKFRNFSATGPTASNAGYEISGGIFDAEPAAQHIVDGSVAIANPDSATVASYPYAVAAAVAQIGDVKYATFAEAIAAADAAVAGGDPDPVIIVLDPTATQDNADWTFVTDTFVEPAVTKLVRRSYYNVWVGGTRIAADNAADVFGDGKVSYDDATKTLTLNGYTYSGAGYGDSAVYIGDVGGATFNIVVAGANSLTSTAAYGYAIRSVGTGAVTVTGSGSDPSLALTVPSTYDTGYAVSVKGTSATFKDLSMSVTGYLGIVVNGNNAAGDALTIDNCDIVFDGTAIDQAIWVYNPMGDGTVSIENGSSLTGKGAILVYGYGTSGGDANLSITDSTVNLTGATAASTSGASKHAIEVLSNYGDSVLTIDNSTVTVTASNGLNPNGNGPDGINVGSQMSANGKGLAKIDIKNGSVVTATGNANGVNLFTWGDNSNVNPCGAELSVVNSTLNASATHATGGHYGIVTYAYQKGDTSVVFENSTVNASAPASAGIYLGAGEDFNADVGNLSYEAIDSDVTTSGPYGLVVSTVSDDGGNTSAMQTVDITGGTFTCNGLLFVYGDDGENTASVSMSDVTAQIGTTDATEEPVLGTITTGELSIDSGDYTILHAADLDAFDAADGNISGGNFNEQVPEDLCADNYIPTPQDPVTGKYTVKVGSYVAQIDTTKYETFAEAIAAAEEYKTENGDYPVITVLDATAEQTNPDWKIADGKLVHKVYVAQIVIDAGATTNRYETLAEAVAAAQSGGTVTLIADAVVNTQINMPVPMTIDFNGKTITSAADNRVFKIATAVGEYTFKNGTVNTTNPCYGLFRVDNASTVTVEGITTTNGRSGGCNFRIAGGAQVLVTNCTITATNGGGVYAEGGSTVNVYDSTIAETGTATDCNASAFAVGEGATITVHNGTYSGEYGAFVCSSGGTIEILDGSVTGRRYAVESDARAGGNEDNSIADSIIRVAGGTIDGELHEEIQLYNNATLTYANKMQISGGMFRNFSATGPTASNAGYEISGGIFDAEPAAQHIVDGSVAIANPDSATVASYPYAVAAAVAQIVRGGNVVAKYESLVAAYNATQAGDTIELLADDRSLSADDNAELTITKSITITGPVDANGDPLYTIYGKNDSNGYNDIFIRAGASDTVTISNVNVAQFGNQASLVMDVAPIYVGGGNAAKVVLDNVHISEFLRIGVVMSGSGEFEVRNCYIDGTRERADTCSYGIEVHRGAHGVIADTTIENISSTSEGWGAACMTVQGQGAVSVTNCTFIGGVSCDGIGTTENATEGACTSVVTIEDSTIDADCAMGMNVAGSQFVVKSGTYGGYLGLEEGIANAAPYSISGGMFEYEVPEEFCADGYIPTPKDPVTGMYTVKQGSYVAQIGTTKYETFAEAIAAADAAVAGGGADPVIIVLDPMATQDNADWTFVTDTSVEPAVTTLVRRSYYNVWVGGTRIAADNAADVFGDGKVSYDAATKTLTLNGYTYSGAGYENSALYAAEDIAIVVQGENSLTSTAGNCIYAGGTISVTGDGATPTLNIAAKSNSYAMQVAGASAAFTNVTMAVSGNRGFVVNENNNPSDSIDIKGCNITFASGTDRALQVWNGEGDSLLTIADSTVTGVGHILMFADGDTGDTTCFITNSTVALTASQIESHNGDATVEISESTVSMTGGANNKNGGFNVGARYGADTTASVKILNNSDVTCSGQQSGINVWTWGENGSQASEIIVADSTLTSSGSYYGMSAYSIYEGDTTVCFTNSTVNATGAISAIEMCSDPSYNAIGDKTYTQIDSAVTLTTTQYPYGLDLDNSTSGGVNGDASNTATITGGSLTCNGCGLYVVGDDDNNSGITMHDAEVKIDVTGRNWYPIVSGELAIDSGTYTIIDPADKGIAVDVGNISGGNFNFEVPEDLCADGYIPREGVIVTIDDVDYYTVKQGSYVAQIMRGGEVIAKYESFTNALEVAESGDTVQLLADIEGVTDTFELRSKNLTIDGQGLYSITAGENTTPRSVVQSYGGARNMFVIQSGNVTFKDITLDGGETHYYTFLVHAKNGTTTFENVELLHGGEADSSGTDGVGYGAAVQVDGANVIVNGTFYADTYGGETDGGIFPFTALLYQSGGVHFDDSVDADIGKDLLLVGMVGAVDVSTDAGREQVNEMLEAMNVPAGYYPYTLKLGDSEMTSFTGASPLGWNGIIDYGTDIMTAANTSMGMGLDPDTTPVEVGLLADTVLPETFTYEDSNLTINGNGNAISGTIEYTDDAGTMENVVMGTDDKPLVLDMTGLSEGNAINLGSSIAASNVTIKVTEEQATTLGQAIVTWNADGESEEDAASLESGIRVEIVDATGQPVEDPVTGDPMEASIIWDAEMGVAYIGPCEARLTGPTHESPIYTSLASAIARAAASGDTVTLLTNIVNYTGTQDISKSLTLDGAGHSITAAPVPADEHRNMFEAWGGSVNMFKIKTGNVTFKNITLDGDATHRYTFLISADNASAALMTENVTLLHGGEQSVDSDGVTLTPGNGYGAAIHLHHGASLTVKDGFYACTGTNENNVTTGVFPFTAILPEGLDEGTSVQFELTDDSNITPTVGIGEDLLLVGMIGAFDVSTPEDKAEVQGILDWMKVPTRFIPYTLKLNEGDVYSFSGASPRTWNEIIDYGKDIMEVATANGFDGLDTQQTPVEVGLLTDTELPDTFTFEDSNFTVNGNGNALSGTIEYTDDAGLIENIVMGTETNPLVIDVTQVTEPIEFGAGVAVTNVTIKMTEEQSAIGTPIIIWDVAGGVEEPENPEGVSVAVVNAAGEPVEDPVTGEPKTASLIWDDELGLAYIGPCDARLTGPTHDLPIYTTLASAISQAKASGDTVTLMTNVTLAAQQTIDKSIEFNLNGKVLAASGDALSIDSGASVQMYSAGIVTGNIAVASGTLTITNGIYVGSLRKASGDGARFVISGGYFSEAVLQEYCADGYSPVMTTAPEYAATPYTVARVEIIYPTDQTVDGLDTVGVPIPLSWINANTDLIGAGGLVLEDLDDIVTGLGQAGANGAPLWQSYVLGLDPNVETSQVRLVGSKATADGTVTITGLNVNVPAILESQGTMVGFHLEEAAPGTAADSNSWTVRNEVCTMAEGLPTFAVPVSTVNGKVLRIVVDIATVSK